MSNIPTLYTCPMCCTDIPEELVLDEDEDGNPLCPDPDCRGKLVPFQKDVPEAKINKDNLLSDGLPLWDSYWNVIK